jgi:hypothetical protein
MSIHSSQLSRSVFALAIFVTLLAAAPAHLRAQAAKPPAPPPDVIVFTNGDQLTGKFVREVGGTVTFHSDIAGDINIGWDKIKELRTGVSVAVLPKGLVVTRKTPDAQIPTGTMSVADQKIALQPAASAPYTAPIPVANAQYIVDQTTLNKELRGSPGFFSAWNGTATAGATIVAATQNQYTFTGAVGLIRIVPTVSWLAPRNRTTADFTASYGKITQPAFTSDGIFTPATATKSDIYHADAERDEYLSPRFFALAQTAFDHNFSQSLNLQQIYGAGIGWTAIKEPKQELDLKATIQYEKQAFENTTPGTNADENLIGSTIAAAYTLHVFKGVVLTQGLNYIPAFNVARAWSVSEADTLTFPAYKNFGFTVGTLDSYLNDVAITEPPTKRNSFQFTMGVTYAFKSKN